MPAAKNPHKIPVRLLDSTDPALPPGRATRALPGSEEKLRMLQERAGRREQLHHPRDCRDAPNLRLAWQRAGNGHLVKTGAVVRAEPAFPALCGKESVAPAPPETPPELLPFGQRLVAIRMARDWERKTLARRSGIDPRVLAYLERDDRVPNLDQLTRLADALECSTDLLLGRAAP